MYPLLPICHHQAYLMIIPSATSIINVTIYLFPGLEYP